MPDDPDEYYDSSLEGCDVVLSDGTRVGTVSEVVHLPAQDLLAVRTPDDRDVLVPFVSAMVPEVDVWSPDGSSSTRRRGCSTRKPD